MNRLLTRLFVGFFLLVSVSAAVTFWSLDAQNEDALVVNLAGRQRMLVQQMARLALELDPSDEAALRVTLHEARAIFEQTLRALRAGGEAPYAGGERAVVPAARTPQIVAQLDRVAAVWQTFTAEIDTLVRAAPDSPERRSAAQAVDVRAAELMQQADAAVRLYQEAATHKNNRLRALQVVFLAGALLLLGLGSWLIRRSVLLPLQQLDRAAERIRADDLVTPVQVLGPEEIVLLSRTMEAMRARLQVSHAELVQLAATLEARVAQRTRELDALNEVSREISSRLDVQHVLGSVTDKARSLLGAEVASLCLLDEQGQWLRLRALSGPTDATVGQTVPAQEGFARSVLDGEGVLACSNGRCDGGCLMLADAYRASHLAAPLRSGARVIGALCVGSSQPDQLAGEAADSLAKLANTAAIALENARLYAQAERVATLEERSRIAADMHDGLGQTLSYLGLMTDQAMEFVAAGQDEAALERLRKTRATIEQATGEVRRAINRLLDESSATPDLCARLKAAVDDFERQNPLQVSWQAEIEPAPACSRETAEQVVNIVREALTNVARHAQAQEISVRLGRVDGHYFVSVEDDGRGFDTSQPEPRGHFGQKIMQVRAEHIGGQIQSESAPGRGTRVRLAWPAGRED